MLRTPFRRVKTAHAENPQGHLRRDHPAWAALCVISDVTGPPTSLPSPSVTHLTLPQLRGGPTGWGSGLPPSRKDRAFAAFSASTLAWTPDESTDHPGIMPTVLGGKGKLSIVRFLLRCACSQVRGRLVWNITHRVTRVKSGHGQMSVVVIFVLIKSTFFSEFSV